MDDIPVPIESGSKRFISQLRSFIRKKGLAYSTEKTYIHWIVYYIRFHKMRHPKAMGAFEVDQFLTYMAVERHVAPGTQKVALNALVFLYNQFLQLPLGELLLIVREIPVYKP